MTASKPRFGSVVTAMVTPFDDEGALSKEAILDFVPWLEKGGTEGIVVAGTTGEGPVLSDDERIALFELVLGVASVPVILSTGTNDTAHSVMLTKRANDMGAQGILAVTPYYNKPSQSGIFDHFSAIADATDLPVMVYDIPPRSVREIHFETILSLQARFENICAVKDATGNLARAARLVAQTPMTFEIYCGDDSLTLPFLSIGAVGVVSVASHWVGLQMRSMIEAFAKGDVQSARKFHEGLFASFDFESTEVDPNPIPSKAMCRVLGQRVGQCRLPMGNASPDLEALAQKILAGLDTDLPSYAVSQPSN